jgi:formate-dependent phosphoribosylglycinamide formyltransferase (GAR transformylase)
MEITDALVTAIVKEILRRLASGELSFSETDVKKAPAEKPCSCGGSAGSPCVVSAVSSSGRKQVISEGDIRRLCPVSAGSGQIVEIGARDIVTPLAEDYISKMRITVKRIG